MSYKIYREGNYIRIIDTLKGELFNGIIKDVFVDKSNVLKDNYRIFNIKDFNDKIVLSISDILKQDGTPYTVAEWETFYTTNTGNFNGGGTAPAGAYEELINKTNAVLGNEASVTKYPSVKGFVDWVTLNVQGAPYLGSIVPTSTPTGTGAAFWTASQPGTYTNFGGVIVSANSFAVISRSGTNTFTISQTPFDLTNLDIKFKTAPAPLGFVSSSGGTVSYNSTTGVLTSIPQSGETFTCAVSNVKLKNIVVSNIQWICIGLTNLGDALIVSTKTDTIGYICIITNGGALGSQALKFPVTAINPA